MKPVGWIALLLLLSLCVQRRTAQTTVRAAQHAGECPPTEDIKLGICGANCDEDEECAGEMKCCPNTCGMKSCQKTDILPPDIPTTQPPILFGNETTGTSTPAAYNQTGNE